MNTTSFYRTTVALAIALTTIGQLSAMPRGDRHVVVDQEKLSTLPAADQIAVLSIQSRLEDILATDRSTLTKPERQALRSEYRELKRDMDRYNAGGTVIYISTAGIIIILLLLIILL